jgi:formylglycine-generating enzyme required for sulfatase activity
VTAVVRKLMAKRAEDRFQTPVELAIALQNVDSAPIAELVENRTGPTVAESHAQPTPLDFQFPSLGGDTTPGSHTPFERRVKAERRQLAWVTIALVVLLALMTWLLGYMIFKKTTGKAEPGDKTSQKKSLSPEEEAAADEKKRQFAEAEAEIKRRKAAEEAVKPLVARAADATTTFVDFAKEVQAFKAKYGGTPAAIKAAELLMKKPSPLDGLDPKELPPDCIDDWRREPPQELVGVLGEHRRHHWGAVRLIGYAADGETIVSVGIDHVCRFWNTKIGLEHSTALQVNDAVECLALSPDGKTVALCGPGYVGPLRLFDTATGRQLLRLDSQWPEGTSGGTGWVSAVFSSDSKQIAALTYGSAIDYDKTEMNKNKTQLGVWDVTSGKRKQWRTMPMGWPSTPPMAFSPDGKMLAFRLQGRHVPRKASVVDVATGEETLLDDIGDEKQSVVQFTEGAEALLFQKQGAVAVLDPRSGKERRAFEVTGGRPTLSPDGKLLAGPDGMLYDFSTGKRTRTLEGAAGLPAFSPDGKHVAYGGADGSIRLWDVETGKEVELLTGHLAAVTQVAFTLDDLRLATVAAPRELKLWDVLAGRSRFTLQGKPEGPCTNCTNVAAFSPDSRLIASGNYASGVVNLWDAEPCRQRTELHAPGGLTVTGVAFSMDGALLAAVDGHTGNPAVPGHIQVWRVGNNQEVWTGQHADPILSVSVSADDRLLATTGYNGTAKVWELATGKSVAEVAGRSPGFNNRALFLPDGRGLCIFNQDGSARLWDLTTRDQRPLPLDLKGSPATSLSSDGRKLAGCGGSTVGLWDMSSGKKLHEWQFPGPVNGVAFAADGRHLATANSNGTIYLLRIPPPFKALSADEATRQQTDAASRLGVPVQMTNSIGMNLNLVPAGRFLMGPSPGAEVTMARSFYTAMTEVTVGQFRAFVKETGYKTRAESAGSARPLHNGDPTDPKLTWQAPGWEVTEEHPVACVSWNDAQAFCTWLSKKDGRAYRLPTQAEWEYACRAGSTTAYCFGNDMSMLGDYGWYEANSPKSAQPVAQRKPNAWGLHDMHGNLYEWCNESASLRSGSFCNGPETCRSDCPDSASQGPDEAFGSVGFRVVCDIALPVNDKGK